MALILFPLVSSASLNDSIVNTTDTGYQVYFTNIGFDVLNVTNDTIEFYNLTSLHTQFTNINATGDAIVQLHGIQSGLTVRNHNTSTDLYTSVSDFGNYNVTFGPGVQIRIVGIQDTGTIGAACTGVIEGFSLFGVFLGLIGITLVAVFIYGKISGTIKANFLVPSLVGLVLAAILNVLGIIITSTVCSVA